MIHILDEPTINQIAAGEVVERPSAVVKELVENAIDAGATAITVEIKEGGLSLIRITDNGAGIDKEDIPLAFLRHATSKIRSAIDLLSVRSLGFRGEALSSIASVSQVELITKTPSALNGYRYIIEGGEEKSVEEIGCPGGTTILVRNIFYNTPARRKFLKSAVTEAGYISDLMERLLVSHPEVSFKYIVNNQVKLQSSGNNNRKDILYHVYGRDIARELLYVDMDAAEVKLSGFIGKPIITRGNRNFENYFINGRYIKSNVITKAIEEAYKPYLMQHKYPFTSLYIEIEPSFIDVNVHPQKLEIRIKNSEEVYRFITEALRNALSRKEMIPSVKLVIEEETKVKESILPEPFEEMRRKQILNNQTSILREKSVYNTYPVHKTAENLYGIGENKLNNGNNATEINENNLPNENNLSCIEENSSVKGYNVTGIKQNNTEKENNISDIKQDNFYKENLISGKNENIYDQNKLVISEKSNENSSGDGKENSYKKEENSFTSSNASEYDVYQEKEILPQNNSVVVQDSTMSIQEETNKHKDEQPENLVTKEQTNPVITDSEQLSLFANSKVEPEETPFLSNQAVSEHRIIGQVFSTYWLVEYKKELYIVDQHAAHEKVLYEKLMKAAKEKNFESQLLLPPIVLTLTLREQEILKKHEGILNQIGYEFEHFGGNEYSVRAVPANLYGLSEKDLLLEFLDDLTEELSNTVQSSNAILERVASLSCKAAIKANHTFSTEEAAALIKELLALENPYHCPHGRPVIISMSQYELEKKFKRIV